jgi:predicted  nucleic acid-binding Zn-ribbon protein
MKATVVIQDLDALLRSLDFIRDEQTYIKNKLAALLESNDRMLVEQIRDFEDMQQQILNREVAIKLIRTDVVALSRQLKNVASTFEVEDKSILDQLKQFKQQTTYLENEFNSWKHLVDPKLEVVE